MKWIVACGIKYNKNTNTARRTNKMNTINEQTATLTKLIAEIVELDSDKQCLAVELDYLIKHLQKYKQTCEECNRKYDGLIPDCHVCGEDCGRTIIVTHQKYTDSYFCSQKCQCIYDSDQDNFTNRMCENPECNKEFDLADPHYYDEDQGVCYCCEECSAV